METKKFALTGAAGYIAPRHMEAIKANGGQLDAILDPNDSVGHVDAYFPKALYFNNFERFERHINKIQSTKAALDFLSICSPNYLHDTHCRFALTYNMDAICEKPLVLSPWNLDMLQQAEQQTGKRIFNILQLRLHPEVIKLKDWVQNNGSKRLSIDLHYITSRGPWYQISWKGQEDKSGGIASNIGIHFFDMLMWIFGEPRDSKIYLRDGKAAAGFLELENADVNWFLSVDASDLELLRIDNQRTYRSLRIDNEEFNFSKGFEDLHIASYKHILENEGFGTETVRPAIELVYRLRTESMTPLEQIDNQTLRKLVTNRTS